METMTQQPCWPDRTITGAFVGWFVDQYGAKTDVYIVRGDEVAFVEAGQINFHQITQVLDFGEKPQCDVAWHEGARLIRAHLAKQSAPPAPATRDELVQTVSRILADDHANTNLVIVADVIVDALHPELKPKPAPVEPSRAELVEKFWNGLSLDDREQMTKAWRMGVAAAKLIGPDEPAPVEAVKTEGQTIVQWYYNMPSLSTEALAKRIDEALAARDAAHQTAMESLRERCAEVAGKYSAE